MDSNNPYCSAAVPSPSLAGKQSPAAIRTSIGFLLGASPPVLLAIYHYYQFQVFVASLPPGTAVCGNSVMWSITLIIFVAPVSGCLGAVIARLIP